MKFLTFIMAFLVLTLSCLPCADCDAVMKDNKAKTALTKTSGAKHNDHEDSCSPFCHCTCCSTHLVVQNIPFFSFNRFSSFTHFQSLIEDNLLERSNPVWQPPQLV